MSRQAIVTQTTASDRAALVALYNATDGPNWENNTYWLSDAPIGRWNGVTTDSSGRVAQLHLYRNQLSGEIPAELGSLTNLTGLSLFNNQLSGEIPAELGNLANLTELYLSDNQLSGEIPEELGRLINLHALYLGRNRLTGCIPEELREIESHDLYELGLPFCGVAGAPAITTSGNTATPVRPNSPVPVTATFSEPVSGFTIDDIDTANGAVSNFTGSGAVYTFEVTPNAIAEVTVDIAAGAATDADGNANMAAPTLSLGIPYDDDGDGEISKNEAITAVIDYFAGRITKAEAIAVIILYFSG